jgi:23S rRNA (uridine2552-2'-O)-methyltransferase
MNRFNPKDHYFEKAKAQGFKARSVFKLEEIDQNLKLIKPDHIILDLGCAPGSWLQYVATVISNKGAVLGVDLSKVVGLKHPRIKTVVDDCFLLTDEKIKEHLNDLVPNFTHFDVVLSDMAPKTSGIKHADQIRSFNLAEKALDLAEKFLRPGGHVVIKVFGQKEVEDLLLRMKTLFKVTKSMRPKSVRAPSKELYVVGMGKK